MDSNLGSSFGYCSSVIDFLLLIVQDINGDLAVDEQFLGTKLLRVLERKIVLKGNLGSYSWFHKWKPSSHELLAFLGLLTISMALIKMSRYRSLLKYERLVPKAHQFSSFLDQFLLKTGY